MTNWLFVILIIALVILFGTFPLKILGEFFSMFGTFLRTLAKTLDFFGWSGKWF